MSKGRRARTRKRYWVLGALAMYLFVGLVATAAPDQTLGGDPEGISPMPTPSNAFLGLIGLCALGSGAAVALKTFGWLSYRSRSVAAFTGLLVGGVVVVVQLFGLFID